MKKYDEFYNYSGTFYEIWEDEDIFAIYKKDEIVEAGLTESQMWDLREELIKG